MKPLGASYKVQRRTAGRNSRRLDGIDDLLGRAKGKSVFDIGCNRGLVSYDFYQNDAAIIHGCDIYELGVTVAREWFADFRDAESRFEVVDLTAGPRALKIFESSGYDFVVCLAVYHKLKRVMPADKLSELMEHFGNWTKKYFAWRGTSDKPDENEEEIRNLDRDLKKTGLQRIHTSYISNDLGVAAIWGRS